MEPRAAQNGARMEEKQSQNRKKCSLAPKMLPGWFQERSGARVRRPKSSILGSPWGPQIDQKSTCGPPKCGRSYFSSDFYSMLRLAQFSDSIWGRIFMKNRCFFQCDFPEILFFFQPGDPHQTLYFTSRNLLFHFFIFSFFHRKND